MDLVSCLCTLQCVSYADCSIGSYTDVDTLFVNPLVSLHDFLPPDNEDPFIMLSSKLFVTST
jgi:hypothetical protein